MTRQPDGPGKDGETRWVRSRAILASIAIGILVVGLALSRCEPPPDRLHGGLNYEDVVAVPQELDDPACNGSIHHVIDVGGHRWYSFDSRLGDRSEYRGDLRVEANGDSWIGKLDSDIGDVEFDEGPTDIVCELSGI